MQSGLHISTILSSARWAYEHTPDTESGLRSHYLSVIIRNRNHFKKSTTMQAEMEEGGKIFFDLFVSMCGHMVSGNRHFYHGGMLTANRITSRLSGHHTLTRGHNVDVLGWVMSRDRRLHSTAADRSIVQYPHLRTIALDNIVTHFHEFFRLRLSRWCPRRHPRGDVVSLPFKLIGLLNLSSRPLFASTIKIP